MNRDYWVWEKVGSKRLGRCLTEANIDIQLNIEIPPEKAFGERDPSKVRMIPLRKLGKKQMK